MDNYDVLEVIGEGTYGVVFKCRDKRTNRIVAVKQFKNFQTNAYVRVAMLRELRVEQLLKSEPNVTQLLETFKQKNRVYLVMEYIPRSLLDVLEEVQHGLPEDSLVVLLFTILLGIRSCHRNGIIHRDVKPENILVRDDGAASLCDFGFCRPLPRQLQPQAPPSSHQLSISSHDIGSSASPMVESGSFGLRPLPPPNNAPQMCNAASVSSENSAMLSELVLADHQAIMTNYVATRWYRSPEMLLGMSSYTYAVDMWAVGAIMAEAIDGEPLLPGKTELEQLSLIQTRIGDFPAAYEAAVRKQNGGMLRLRSLNPLAAPPQQLRTKSMQQKSRRASDVRDAAQKRTESKQSTSSYLTERYGGRIAKAGLNLLHGLLRIDAAERITVEEALGHPYFDSVRGRFDATANGARRVCNSNGACDEAADMRPTTAETAESMLMPLTTAASRQAPLPPLTATGAVDCTSPFLSTSDAAGGGSSPCLVAAAPPLVEVPFSLVDRVGAGADDDGGGPLQMPCGAERSPRVTTVAWGASSSSPGSRAPCGVAGSNSSASDSSSLSLWTASDTSAEVDPPTDVTAAKDHVSFPGLSSVLVSLHPESPKPTETDGHHAAAAACNRAAEGSNSTPRQLAPEEDNNDDQPVLRRQAASEGANTRAIQRDASMHSYDCSSTSLFQSRQRQHSPRDARQLRHRTSSLESGGSVTALRGSDSSRTNTAAQEASGAGGAVSATAASGMDVPASLSVLQSRRTAQRRSGSVVNSRLSSSKISAASACRTASPPSLLAKSYSFKSIPTSRSKALAPAEVQSTSKYDLMQSVPEDHTEKRRRPSGPASSPRCQDSRGSVEKRAAANSKGAHTCSSSSMTFNALRSARGDPGCTGGLGSATKERHSSVGRRIDGHGLHVVPAAPSCVNATTPGSSCRATAQEPVEVSSLRRRSTAKSRPPQQPGRRTSTPTARAGIANGTLHSPALTKPLFVRSSPEASASLSVSDARVGGGKKRGLSRFVSPNVPREVRPLPAPERVTLLQEIESLGFLVGTPSAVEVLAPVVAAPVSHTPRHAESKTDAGGGARGRNEGDTRASAIARADHLVRASQPPEMLDNDVQPDGHRGGGNSTSLLTLGETRRQCSGTASSRASAAKRGTAASGETSAFVEGAASSELEDHGRQQNLQRPPHPCGSTGGRPPRTDVNSLSGNTSTHSANATTVGSSRAAPSLIFRSARTASSPLKLATIHPSSFAVQGEGELRELSTSGCHAKTSASTGMSFTAPSNSVDSPPTCRLAPALLRHHHPTTAVGACSVQAYASLGPDPVFGSSAFSAHSPLVAKGSARSPTLSPNPQKRSDADARRVSMESPIVSLSGKRQQRRLSDIPIELSLSEELFADSAACGPRGGRRRHENTTPLSTTPPITMPDDLETVVLMGTPSASRRTDQRPQDEVPCTATWSSARSGTTAMMSSNMPGNSTPFRGLDGDSDGLSAPFEGKGSAAKTEAVDITARTTRHGVAPSLFAAVPKGVPALNEDDVRSVCETPSLPIRGSLEACGAGNSASTSSRKIPGPSLAPPQPLLGGASVLSAQQLHAGGGRRKSRLVL
ncbi:putative mitogen-activated protein kinase [Leishmania major strain Friedlin]|uniref:cyclin-dependent kinase n=1 Tax=Leishmania major TaxID=5664 RepID=Q4Q8L2_LEIMA|nr:putative mitogen-activated protein kinase [Leishmania major strain Friedlin]CAG9577132.1 Mitogen-activated_protein_kinase_8_-_putative [Leishmania major strain Friedlin]CAJ05049.1 putative mitogen-activated protein kinase [Leishmania major strain Friedlin]|eukprot:XP_001684336.1 putative mitogen-activated protein kinase [Leishmania major strain Friedlin]